jgi:hypothetical protein
MILGQLFFYSKELNRLLESKDLQLLKDVQILGIDPNYFNDINKLSKNDALKLLAEFIYSYSTVLQKESLEASIDFWNVLVNPLKIDVETTEQASEYIKELYDWVAKGSKINEISALLSSGVLTNTEEDYALYYGLNVIYVINSLILSNSNESVSGLMATAPDLTNTHSFSNNPQSLVITSLYKTPLFKNINAICLDSQKLSHNQIIQELKLLIKDNNDISIIFIDTDYVTESHSLEKFIKKQPELKNIYVSNIKLSEISEDNFFDEIVMSTLGVKLV